MLHQLYRHFTSHQLAYLLLCVLALLAIFELGVDVGRTRARPSLGGGFHTWRERMINGDAVRAPEDEHVLMLDSERRTPSSLKRRTPYPGRINMGECPRIFGSLAVLVIFEEGAYSTWASRGR